MTILARLRFDAPVGGSQFSQETSTVLRRHADAWSCCPRVTRQATTAAIRASHPARGRLSIIRDYTCVTVAALASGSPWTFPSRKNQPQPLRPRCRLNINAAESAIDAAIAGIGITHVLSYQVAYAVAEGKLRVVLEDFELAPMPLHLIHAAQGRLPLKMRSFLEFAAPHLRKSLIEDERRLARLPRGAKSESKPRRVA
jgi:DNA-binding transcriptional LysR family regulator